MASSSRSSNRPSRSTKTSSSTPKKPLNFSFRQAQTFVTIFAGKSDAQEEFRIHKNVITYYSPFFSTAFNSQFKEGQTQTMVLTDVEAPIFGHFNNWLYTQKFETEDGKRLQLIEYAKLWSLAQRFLMPELKANLLQEVRETDPSSDVESGSTLKDFQHYVYLVADAQKDSDLKTAVIQKTLSSIETSNIDQKIQDFPEGMLVDFTTTLLKACTKLSGWALGLGIEGVGRVAKKKKIIEEF